MFTYYRDPQVTGVNRLPARARTFADAEQMSLNGEWQLRLFDRPEKCLDAYIRPGDPKGFRPVSVPGNAELQGFGKPVYTNYVYPWPYDSCGIDGHSDPWRLPEENPVLCYRKVIRIPAVRTGKRYILRLEGVETAYELYVNGVFAGYAEDSKLASEFDITGDLREGDNLIALKVYRFATSSYLEDQDYWYLTGIYRPVTLFIVPEQHIEDYRVKAVPDRYLSGGTFSCDVAVSRVPGYAEHSVRVTLLDAAGGCVASGTGSVNAECGYSTEFSPTANTARVEFPVSDVTRWYPERPYLYTVKIELIDASGAVVDTESVKIGFKRVDIENGILLLNGMRAEIFGVNRHEFAWRYGRAVPEEHMRREIAEMKKMNVNAVRTCHYPDSALWYSLCDELGLWVLCECDLETHGVSGAISHNAAFAPVYVERAQRMVAQHANHTCVYGWSLGNESGFGPGHAAMYGLVKQMDDTRLCQYEAGNPGKNISDIRGTMYATVGEILKMLADPADDRPIILVEYLYQIRNAGGGMQKFIDLMTKYKRFQGGFVWDWQDKALAGTAKDGTEYFAHGGDFNESFVDYEVPLYMTNNGLVRADLTWKPVAYDVREAYAPVLIEREFSDNAWAAAENGGCFTVYNRSRVHTLSEYEIKAFFSNGEPCEPELPDLRPGEKARIDLRGRIPAGKTFVDFIVTAKYDCLEKAHRQFLVSDAVEPQYEMPAAGSVTVRKTGNRITMQAAGARAVFSSADGMLLSYSRGDKDVACNACLTFDRPYCGLDAEPGWGWRKQMDHARAVKPEFSAPRLLKGDACAELTAQFAADEVRGAVRWTLDASGALSLALDADTAEGFCPPRIGIGFTMPGGMRAVTYTGFGPRETYPDRLVSARFGTYTADVRELGFDYAPPSENGGREGVTSLVFAGEEKTLSVASSKPFHFDARTATTEDLKQALHTHEVPERKEITVHLDAYHMPIGGDMAWSTMLSREEAPHAGHFALNAVLCAE